MATLIDKYTPQQGGGLGGLWNTGTKAAGNLMTSIGGIGDTANRWGDALIYGGIAIAGAIVLFVGYSFASGTQKIGDIATVVKAVKP